MKSYELIGYSLAQTSAITAIVGTRIYHGNRLEGSAYPAINYFSVGNRPQHGIISKVYSINCRAESVSVSENLAMLVARLFDGDSFNGTYGLMNGFNVSRASLNANLQTISEPGDMVFNTPVDIRIVFHSNEET
jgi:hypothetical protein